MKAQKYSTPGVYRLPASKPGQGPDVVRTDIAGFVGYAERGPLPPLSSTAAGPQPFVAASLAVKITSWQGYRDTFGGLVDGLFLPYAVDAFFQNGGTTCYVVRVSGSNPNSPPATASYAVPAVGVPVPPTTTLAAAVPAASVDGNGQATIKVGDAGRFSPGDAIEVQVGKGTAHRCVERMIVLGKPAATTLQVKRGNPPVELAAGAAVSRFAGSVTTSAASATQPAATVFTPTTAFTIGAASPGTWGNRIHIRVSPVNNIPWICTDSTGRVINTTMPLVSISVRIDPSDDPQQLDADEIYLAVALTTQTIPANLNVLNADDVNLQSKLIRISGLGKPTCASPAVAVPNEINAQLAGGADGWDAGSVKVSDMTGGSVDYRGLRVLEEVEEVTILCVPDAVDSGDALPPLKAATPVSDPCAKPPTPAAPPPVAPPAPDTVTIYQAMVDQCSRLRNRVAILDTDDGLEPAAVLTDSKTLGLPDASTPFAAIYYPWVEVPDTLTGSPPTRRVPPSGHIAGVYAAMSNGPGVQHAPANIELNFAVDVGRQLSDVEHGNLNDAGVNAIRCIPGRGIRVLGARSLATAVAALSPWTFIHVRRVFSWVEDSVRRVLQWTVFENNDVSLRSTVTHCLNVFLERIWLTGGLQGANKTQAYYVTCDQTNNPQTTIDAGQLICQIGLAVAAPMEFIEFQICRDITGVQVVAA